MKLRTGKPLWLDSRKIPLRVSRLTREATFDVAIIGAGITGALAAHQLLAAGCSVVVLDKRRAGYGSTAASTGLLLFQPDTTIADLTQLHDQRTARRVYELGRQAIRELGALSRQLAFDCGWQPKRTLYVASRPSHTDRVRAEARRTRRLGFPATLLSAAQLRQRHQIDFPAALLEPGSAQIDAFDLTRAVLHRAQRESSFALHQHTRVTSLREGCDAITLRTDTGGTIHAAHVIVAAGYESRQFVRSSLVRLKATYVIASPPLDADRLRPLRCLMWETARPYFYLRTTADHRIIFGGADEPFDTVSSRKRTLQRKTRELEQQFASLFPSLAFAAEHAWFGTFAETTDGLPCIGPAQAGSRIFYALGYGGNGITFSQIAARFLRDACLGKTNSDAELFAFDRLRKRRGQRRQE
jgi:glycine/D-amino acid oxidase-like deaminating enzyme